MVLDQTTLTYLSARTASQDRFAHVVDTIFYILRTGCQWRYLPKIFRPRAPSSGTSTSGDTTAPSKPSTTYFAARSARGEALLAPDHASVDSQSVDTTSGGEQRGRDNAKNVDGRKRHIVVDSIGLLMAVLVTAASIDDAKAAAELFARLDVSR